MSKYVVVEFTYDEAQALLQNPAAYHDPGILAGKVKLSQAMDKFIDDRYERIVHNSDEGSEED